MRGTLNELLKGSLELHVWKELFKGNQLVTLKIECFFKGDLKKLLKGTLNNISKQKCKGMCKGKCQGTAKRKCKGTCEGKFKGILKRKCKWTFNMNVEGLTQGGF